MAWTDDELRAAIDEAASVGGSISIDHVFEGSTETVANYAVQDTRHLLTALGIDHQPKPELPDTPGSTIHDVVIGDGGNFFDIMTLNRSGFWVVVSLAGNGQSIAPSRITSFGGVLDLEALRDLDKVRGEQGEC